MLKKLPELEVPDATPFDNDKLERKGPIERLTALVESTTQPFVLSVEAPWGWGKTTFIRMWKAHLEGKGHICLQFNAWENDFVDDPLVAFLGEMRNMMEKEAKEAQEPMRSHWTEVKRIGAGVLRKALPLAVQVATQGLLSQEAVKHAAGALTEGKDELAEFASTLAKERLNNYELERSGIKAFRENLAKLAEEVLSKDGRVGPLVFFIDELDRCRPDFAVALLERVKHLFNVNRVVFVLALDRAQLNQSVKALYGLEMDPDGYLRRFIDLAYSLPSPTTKTFVETLYQRFAMDECLEKFPDGAEGARIWRVAFAQYAEALRLSLRAQEQCFTEMNIVWRTSSRRREFHPAVLSAFAALRAYSPQVVSKLRHGEIDAEIVLNWFNSVKDPWYRHWAKVAVIHGFVEDGRREQRLRAMKEQILKEGLGARDSLEVEAVADFMCNRLSSSQVLFVLAQLEMVADFK